MGHAGDHLRPSGTAWRRRRRRAAADLGRTTPVEVARTSPSVDRGNRQARAGATRLVPWTRSRSHAASVVRLPAGAGPADCARLLERDGDILSPDPVPAIGAARPIAEWPKVHRTGAADNGGLQGCPARPHRRGQTVAVESPTTTGRWSCSRRMSIVWLQMTSISLVPQASRTAPHRGARSRLHDPDVPEPGARSQSAAARSRGSRRQGVPILEDDPYGLVRFEGESPPAIWISRARRRSTPRPSRSDRAGFGRLVHPAERPRRPLIERANGT